ncbi:hypothetical protein GV794_24780 [Nocardia cyriacigeorgica]|uniref:WXG100 family type VII secretion target n=1 Tax=Nocardia cyriacigeorgica TaxID=135487 RepID=A0A6P1DCG3_9NOCA|nr:hypothetical protein [Nocardia cyriacigeorgica]NEW42589.1 hypothetical protein [Nocardia cyriacigeorgica]NEW47291.1 hypothetical protein [Nocardia cyriacigeorgica]NEW53694.1 hypothetical protein [Nocardia cyriacigeorgica]NEW58828.1 hypothetical protein [Nocardia cyriacigeorgica]
MSTPYGTWINEHTPGFDDAAAPKNPLIADGTDYRDEYFAETNFMFSNVGFEGKDGPWGVLEGTVAADAWKIVSNIRKGEITDAVFSGISTGITAAGAVGDPFGFVGGQIAGWMLEHVEPLRKCLDGLWGNPDMIEAYSETWKNISTELTEIAAAWRTAVDTEVAEWNGLTAQAYRARVATLTDNVGGAAGVAAALATTVEQTAKIIDAIRTLVSEILTALAGALIGYTIELAISLGTAAPLVAAQAMFRIGAETAKVSTLMAKLANALLDFKPFEVALGKIVTELLGTEEPGAEPQAAPA